VHAVPGSYKSLLPKVSQSSDRGGRIDPGDFTGLGPLITSNAERAPRCGVLTAGVDPPKLFTDVALCGRRGSAHRCPGNSQAAATASLRALLRNARQKGTDLGLPVAAVTAERPNRRELPCLCPPSDCLGVNPEHCCDLCRREQRLGLWCTCRHNDGLSSWTSLVILTSSSFLFMAPSEACTGCPI
jgi:hypothetical protein